MTKVQYIPWSPRVIMTGRKFCLPVQTNGACPKLETGEFQIIDHRWSERDQAFFSYLKSPMESGDCTIIVQVEDQSEQVSVQVCHLDQLRNPHEYNGVYWPRRWPVGQPWHSTKTRQTLQDLPISTPN